MGSGGQCPAERTVGALGQPTRADGISNTVGRGGGMTDPLAAALSITRRDSIAELEEVLDCRMACGLAGDLA
jgi:hypothetical protein